MTRPVNDVVKVLDLGARGLTPTEIARATGIPRRTVHDWLHERAPRRCVGLQDTCPHCGHAEHKAAQLPSSYVYLLGIYLGDGCVSAHPRGVFKLRIVLDAAYPLIIDEVTTAMGAVLPRSRALQSTRRERDADGQMYASCVEVYSYSRSWPCLFPQHGPGKKHERRIVLATWQAELVALHPKLLLRGLIHSDGCRFTNTGRAWVHPRYAFKNVSDDIRALFVQTCEVLGIHTTFARPNTIYVSRKDDVARMDQFIGPKA